MSTFDARAFLDGHPDAIRLLDENPMMEQAAIDLAWLFSHGALAGVAEVLAERRRQVELGWTPELDKSRTRGQLMLWAINRLGVAHGRVIDGGSGLPGHEEACRQVGALAAAEIDRLNRAEEGSPS